MNNPVSNFHAETILQIEGDPNLWGLATLQTQDPGWNRPVAIEIGAPVEGRLILSPACVGSFSLTHNDAENGWHPAVLPAGSLFLYIPTTTVLKDASSGYILAGQYDNLDALQESIMGAMRSSSTLALNVGTVGGGVVILSGASLPFAVIAEGSLVPAPLMTYFGTPHVLGRYFSVGPGVAFHNLLIASELQRSIDRSGTRTSRSPAQLAAGRRA